MRRSPLAVAPLAVTVLAVVLLAAFSLVGTAAFSAEKPAPAKPPAYHGLKKRIAVLPITLAAATTTTASRYGPDETYSSTTRSDLEAVPGGLGAAMTEQLTTALINTGRFVVLERRALDEVLGEQDLGASGRVNPDTAAQTGKVIGADWLIRAAITEFEQKKSRSGGGVLLRGVGLGGTRSEAFVALDVRIVDAETGEVIDSVKADGRAKQSGALGGFKLGEAVIALGKEDKTPIGQATRAALTDAIDFICNRMEQLPWQSRVMEVDGTDVFITGGSNMNLKTGTVFDVFHRGKALVDPDTGQTLGHRERRLGALRVVEVLDKYSIGVIVEGPAPERGDVVRCSAPSAPPAPAPAPQGQ